MGGVAVMKPAESRRPSKLFAKPFQKQRVSLQAFPKKALVVLWDFNELQGLQIQSVRLQIFSPRRPPFSLVPDARRAAFRRLAPRGFENVESFAEVTARWVGDAFMAEQRSGQ